MKSYLRHVSCLCPDCMDKISQFPKFIFPEDPKEIRDYEFMFFKIEGEIYWGMKKIDIIEISDFHRTGKNINLEFPLEKIEAYAYREDL